MMIVRDQGTIGARGEVKKLPCVVTSSLEIKTYSSVAARSQNTKLPPVPRCSSRIIQLTK
jgi:hypothetical protein